MLLVPGGALDCQGRCAPWPLERFRHFGDTKRSLAYKSDPHHHQLLWFIALKLMESYKQGYITDMPGLKADGGSVAAMKAVIEECMGQNCDDDTLEELKTKHFPAFEGGQEDGGAVEDEDAAPAAAPPSPGFT